MIHLNQIFAKKPGVFSYSYETAGRGPAIWGFLVLVPFLVILGAWAAIAEINAAAIAIGEVVLNQDRKTIQHLEGGIIDEILISEGDPIERGAPILVIRDVSQRTRINTLYNQLASARALRSRLTAERDGAENPSFDGLTTSIELPKVEFESLKATQIKLFDARQKSLMAKIDLIKSRKIASSKEIIGLTHQLKSIHKQLELTNEETKTVQSLYKRKLITGNRVMQLERDTAEFEGEAGSISANIARLEQAIVGADIEIIDLKTEIRNQVLEELQQAELNEQELTHQLIAMSDQLERTIIKAPVTGRAMDLQFHTRGAVIQPGQRILDIVPDDDRLIVEARLLPNDIDIVFAGLKTKVLLSAYKAKKVPKLDGEVLSVSADILTDTATGERYFLARILVDDKVLKDLKADVALYPGMPAQVFFLAGERTVADYLLSPIIDATYRAFREE